MTIVGFQKTYKLEQPRPKRIAAVLFLFDGYHHTTWPVNLQQFYLVRKNKVRQSGFCVGYLFRFFHLLGIS